MIIQDSGSGRAQHVRPVGKSGEAKAKINAAMRSGNFTCAKADPGLLESP